MALSDHIKKDSPTNTFATLNVLDIKYGTGTFSDGNTQAVMAVFKFQEGKIISLETGATNMPK